MRKSCTLIYFVCLNLCLLNISNAQEVNDGDTLKPAKESNNLHGDWKISCPQNAPCRMAQSIVSAPNNDIILQLRIFKEDKPTALFSFPLGILLNTGWQINVDGGKSKLLPFEICKLDGCHSGITLSASLLNQLKRGNTLNVKFFDAKQTPIEPMISLKGFTKAWQTLK